MPKRFLAIVGLVGLLFLMGCAEANQLIKDADQWVQDNVW